MAGRSSHLSPAAVGLVVVGGTVGTLARYVLTLVIPAEAGTFVVNVSGAFLLGLLLAALPARRWRLLLGTGVLGGYTTYSAYAVDTDGLLLASDVGGAVLYGLATVLVGAAATLGGVALGGRWSRRRG